METLAEKRRGENVVAIKREQHSGSKTEVNQNWELRTQGKKKRGKRQVHEDKKKKKRVQNTSTKTEMGILAITEPRETAGERKKKNAQLRGRRGF